MMNFLHQVDWGTVAEIAVVAVGLIVYIVRIEMRLRAVATDFDACKKERRERLADLHARREALSSAITHSCELIQNKLDQLIRDTGILTGKISMLESRIKNGGSE